MKRVLLCMMIMSTMLMPVPALSASPTVIKVGGSGTGSGVMRHLAAEFEKQNPDIKITIAPSLGSSGGLKALISGSLDLALSARPLKDEEKGSGAVPVFSGRSPFVFMVNKGVSRSTITVKELEEYYGLRQLHWPDGSAVRLVLRPEGDTDTRLVQALSPELHQAVKSTMARQGLLVALTDQESDKAITHTPGALGTSTLAQYLSDSLDGKMLALHGVKPSLKTMKNGSYPLAKVQMAFVIPGRTTAAQKKFITFLTTSRALRLWEKYGILPDKGR